MKRRVMVCLMVLCCGGLVWGQPSASSETNVATSQTTNVGSNAGGTINNQSGASATGGDASVSEVSSTSQGGAASSTSQGGGVDFDYSPTSVNKYPTPKMGLVSPGHPNPPWMYPLNYDFWNGINADPKIYQRWWTLSDTDDALKRIRNRGFLGLSGNGFRYEISLDDYEIRPSSKSPTIFTITQSVDMGKLLQSYECIGVIVVTGDVRRHFDQVARKVIDIALCYDIDVAYLSGALNPVNDGATSSGPGVGGATAGTQYSLSLIGGALSTKSEVVGKPYVCLQCFRKIPVSMRTAFVKYVPPVDVAAALDGGQNIVPPSLKKMMKPEAPTPPVEEQLKSEDGPAPLATLSKIDSPRNVLSALKGLGVSSDDDRDEDKEEGKPVVLAEVVSTIIAK